MSVARSALALVALAIVVSASPAQAQDARVVAKAGYEYDTNARRIVGSETRADQLARLFLKADLGQDLGAVGRVATKLLVGAKLHAEVSDEDAVVTSLVSSWTVPLFREEETGGSLFLRADVGDRSERSSVRDYFRGAVVAGFRLVIAPVSVSLGAGYRGFLYKPDYASNHNGFTGEASLAVRLPEGFATSLSYLFIGREFSVPRFVETETGLVTVDPFTDREDELHSGRLAVSFNGFALASASYTFQVNDSNSFGPGLTRHIGQLSWTQPIYNGIHASLRGRVQRTIYDDPVRIDETLQIDDEDRNQVIAGISVPIPPIETAISIENVLALELRYSLYTQALDEDADFVRHLLYVGLSAELDPLLL